MRNTIKLLPTDDKSNLYFNNNDNLFQCCLEYKENTKLKENKYLYITSTTEPLVLGGYHFNSKYGDEVCKTSQRDLDSRKYWEQEDYFIERVIFSNDLKLIEDNIEKIPIDFIRYFISKTNDSGKSIDYVESELVFVNPMGRIVNPNNVGQNNSSCIWQYKLLFNKLSVNEEETFLDYIEDERKTYIDFICSLVWNNETRTKATSLLIAFDQMKEKLIENKII